MEIGPGLGIARIVEELVVFPKPTVLVTTGIMMCLWLNHVGMAVGDGVGGSSFGCGWRARAWFAAALRCGSRRRGEG